MRPPHPNAGLILGNVAEYDAWKGAKRRCAGKNPRARLYVVKGIRVCDRWLGPDGFRNFLADMGKRPSAEHSLDRIDNAGHYEPVNCRWATPLVQQTNRSDNVFVEHGGRRLCIQEWARELGLRANTLQYRIAKGWPVERAFARPMTRGECARLSRSPIVPHHKDGAR